MKESRFSEAQIVGILKEVEMGAKVGETCRKHGISEPTYYKWKNQFSGMTVSHLSQLRQLQEENAKLKPRAEPYWVKLSTGCMLDYRKMTSSSTGSWIAHGRCANDVTPFSVALCFGVRRVIYRVLHQPLSMGRQGQTEDGGRVADDRSSMGGTNLARYPRC